MPIWNFGVCTPLRRIERFLIRFHFARERATCVELQPLPGLWLSQAGPCSVRACSFRRWFLWLLIFLFFLAFHKKLQGLNHQARNRTSPSADPAPVIPVLGIWGWGHIH